MNKKLTSILLAAGLLFSSTSFAAPLVEGKEFIKIPVPADRITPANGKIEVIEVFSYTCGHCFALEPFVDKWLETKDEGINFQKLAMPGERTYGFYAQTYYTLESMGLGLSKKANHAVFNGFLTKKLKMQDKTEMAEYLASEADINKDEFIKNWDSFGVKMKIERATKITNTQYQLQFTPAFVVDGKYLVSSSTAADYVKGDSPYQNLMTVTDLLAKQLLAERPQTDMKAEANTSTEAPK